MLLEKRLFVNGKEVDLIENKVSLKLNQPGKAIFVCKSDKTIKIADIVCFKAGYNKKLKHIFFGFVDKVQQADTGSSKIVVKELCGRLTDPCHISIEHATLTEVIEQIGELTKVDFVLPDAEYVTKKIPNFVSSGSGLQCIDNIARAFSIDDMVWFQQPDKKVWLGAFKNCIFFGKNVSVSTELTTNQFAGTTISFPCFPMLRPGVVINGDRITKLELFDDEMTATWSTHQKADKKKKAIFDLFPELESGQHLPIMGRIEAVRDQAKAGQQADPYRPRFAVDVQVLNENMVAAKVPVFRSVPLPVSFNFAYPPEGSVCEIAFAYGRSDLPIIRNIYPRELALPAAEAGEQLQYQRFVVFDKTDAAGNQYRATDQEQKDSAFIKTDIAEKYQATFGNKHEMINQHSTEEVAGKKLTEALGAIDLLAGDDLVLGSLGNMQMATAGELVEVIGKLRLSVAAISQTMQAPLSWIGTKEINIFNLLDLLIVCVQELASHCASHKHISNGKGAETNPPTNASDFTEAASTAKGLHNQLAPIIK